jgi:hypothetical protein
LVGLFVGAAASLIFEAGAGADGAAAWLAEGEGVGAGSAEEGCAALGAAVV